MKTHFTILLLLLVGCAHSPEMSGQAPVTMAVLPEHPELTRDDNRKFFEVQLAFHIESAGSAFHPESLVLHVAGKDRAAVRFDFAEDVLVTPGTPLVWKTTRPGYEAADWRATLIGRTEGGREIRLVRTFHVANTQLDEALAACRACDGMWGRHGLLQWEGCICKSPDGGRRCVDGLECRGRCLFEAFEIVEEAKEPTCDEHGACRASLGVRRAVGRCSEYETIYGCHAVIRDGASSKPPESGMMRMSTICID